MLFQRQRLRPARQVPTSSAMNPASVANAIANSIQSPTLTNVLPKIATSTSTSGSSSAIATGDGEATEQAMPMQQKSMSTTNLQVCIVE